MYVPKRRVTVQPKDLHLTQRLTLAGYTILILILLCPLDIVQSVLIHSVVIHRRSSPRICSSVNIDFQCCKKYDLYFQCFRVQVNVDINQENLLKPSLQAYKKVKWFTPANPAAMLG